MRLKAEFDTVLAWRKENEGDSTSWHEIDLNDVKIIEAKGDEYSLNTRSLYTVFPLRLDTFLTITA